ncbi:hypothetical protein RIR_jg21806.t1 [Rhizophagus irregularis DAOM 181602=DAOM 197198]|nr:hypothetical protein RIR_jg21806.t1 [Rhizophagus irregularis DAOM 181602=DAOM 197198]
MYSKWIDPVFVRFGSGPVPLFYLLNSISQIFPQTMLFSTTNSDTCRVEGEWRFWVLLCPCRAFAVAPKLVQSSFFFTKIADGRLNQFCSINMIFRPE